MATNNIGIYDYFNTSKTGNGMSLIKSPIDSVYQNNTALNTTKGMSMGTATSSMYAGIGNNASTVTSPTFNNPNTSVGNSNQTVVNNRSGMSEQASDAIGYAGLGLNVLSYLDKKQFNDASIAMANKNYNLAKNQYDDRVTSRVHVSNGMAVKLTT